MPCDNMSLQNNTVKYLHKAKRAVILAAGMGSRLRPLTDFTPKPLVKVNGKAMIETMIEGLISHGITEIYVVVGYLKEQFDYLPSKYTGLSLIVNPYYETHNNISSLYVARAHLESAIICDGDLVLVNPEILYPEFNFSGYCSAWVDESHGEWLQFTDADGFVLNCSRTGGLNGWQLFSVSFWTDKDGVRLKKHLEELFYTQQNAFWDDIVHFIKKDEYRLCVRKIKMGDIIEIDTLEEYKSYSEV